MAARERGPEPVAQVATLPELAPIPEPAPVPALAPIPEPAPDPAASSEPAPELTTAVICEPEPDVTTSAEPEPEPVTEPPAPEPVAAPAAVSTPSGYMFKREMSALEHFFYRLDEFLRDPSLTLALRAFTDRLKSGLRDLGAQVAEAARRAARAIAALQLPRRLLLGLLALLLPLVLLALLLGGDDDQPTTANQQRPSQAPANGAGFGAAGMPRLAAAPDRVPAATVALVVDGSLAPAALRRELGTLGSWLAANHAPGTRVTLIDATSGRASAPLSGSQLARASATLPRSSTTAAVRAALAREGGRRLLVDVGGAAAGAAPRASTLDVATRPGASFAPAVALARGGRAAVTIDERRPNALAASVARALMAISGQRERR